MFHPGQWPTASSQLDCGANFIISEEQEGRMAESAGMEGGESEGVTGASWTSRLAL